MRQSDRRHHEERVEEPRAGKRARRAASGNQERGLEEQLRHDPSTVGAERGADRELAAAIQHTREQETADVDSGDDEERSRGDEQKAAAAPQRLAPALAHGLDLGAVTPVDVGIARRERRADRCDLCLGFGDRPPRTETGDRPARPAHAIGLQRPRLVVLKRDEELDDVVFDTAVEAGLCDANDRVHGS